METVVYRGSLKSCNYRCSYCPFSKHGTAGAKLAKDREQWFSFVDRCMAQEGGRGACAVMVAPYGEALVHPWYWEGLARISSLSAVKAVGAQTNLSFPPEKSLEAYVKYGGKLKKLRLWATFHPEMTTVGEFAKECRLLAAKGVSLCAGAVGVPANAALLQQLRAALPQEVYLWINRMDGLGRAYTQDEIQLFCGIDPYFYRELQVHPADPAQCADRLFVEGDARERLCSISAPGRECRRKTCSCYLAYGGRNNLVNQMLFGPLPLFRIPRQPKAVFLDIEGTLLPADGKRPMRRQPGTGVPQEMKKALEVLSEREGTLLFFATTLPFQEARKRCRAVWHLFSGGVFAAGAHVLLRDRTDGHMPDRESFFLLEEEAARYFEPVLKRFSARMLVYRENGGRCYKITLVRAQHLVWSEKEAEQAAQCLPERFCEKLRFLAEGHCLQVVAAQAHKAAGVKLLCGWLGFGLDEVFAAGDSKEDAKMMELCGR